MNLTTQFAAVAMSLHGAVLNKAHGYLYRYVCGTVSVEGTRDQQLGCCLATELGIDCERVSAITAGAVTSYTVGLLTGILSGAVSLSLSCTACGNNS